MPQILLMSHDTHNISSHTFFPLPAVYPTDCIQRQLSGPHPIYDILMDTWVLTECNGRSVSEIHKHAGYTRDVLSIGRKDKTGSGMLGA